jgi:hypothetical protein
LHRAPLRDPEETFIANVAGRAADLPSRKHEPALRFRQVQIVFVA